MKYKMKKEKKKKLKIKIKIEAYDRRQMVYLRPGQK